ncbi:hypothetical protein BD289DRAFT_482970 [Coniella lustricola]|uniref:Secreted protein n=1 Tax=Coniella lustricola TaxID=2025994 RepID=A0A2T3A713_9PEZI|nr:hypothetical protein BD289DRAFT_482970 [Coniella lustricola]
MAFALRTRVAALVTAVALISTTIAASPKPSDFGQRPASWIKYDVPSAFANPTGLARPTFRYWVPDADVDDHVLYADLKTIHDSGWGSVEVICLENYGIELAVVDPAEYGYGGDKWRSRFATMLRAAEELNMTVDFALGPTQGASIPIFDPDTRGMNTELAYGNVSIASGATFSGALPPPGKTYAGYANAPDFDAPFQNYKNTFVAAVVVKKSTVPSSDPRITALDVSDIQDVTLQVQNGTLVWTAPGDGSEYVLFTFYQRRTGYLAAQGAFNNATDPDNPASWFAYVVDHFSQAGTDLWTSFTEDYVMNGENGDLLRQLGLYAWEDSAEFRATLFWTDDFLDYFKQTRGYSLVPYLPILFGTTGLPPSTLANGYYYFSYDSSANTSTAIDWKIRNDFYQALQTLYETYHLDGLSTWSSQWNLQGSLQPYATAPQLAPPWDMVSAAAHIDAPETESNYFDGVIDAFRAMAGGAMLGRKQIFSSELGAHRYFAYAATWPLLLNDCAINYAGGVNRIVTHGFPYSGWRPEVEWPGLTTFEWTYSEMWGPRQPTWEYVRETADWIARTQLILQTGVPRVDIGVYRHKYLSVDIKHYGMGENLFGTKALQNAGYAYVAVSPSLLSLDNAVITNGTLAADGPAFSALLIDNSTNITTTALTQLTRFAAQNFPILFIGGLPTTSPYFSSTSTPTHESLDTQIQQDLQHLLTYPSVQNLTSESEVVDALKALGVAPAAENIAPPVPLTYTHRWDEENAVDYYWVYNSDLGERHSTLASLRWSGSTSGGGSAIPYVLDAWTGRIAPVVNYTVTNTNTNNTQQQQQHFNIWFDLASNQSTIIALAPASFFTNIAVPPIHITNSNFEAFNVTADGTAIMARTTRNETSQEARQAPLFITLSNGTKLTGFESSNENTTTTTVLPAPFTISPWSLTVQDWLPNPDPWSNYTSVYAYHNFTQLDELVPWYNISSSLLNTSGVGVYKAEFAWPPTAERAETKADGAYLDLSGHLLNTVRIYVNEHWTGPVDVTSPVIDIGPFLLPSSSTAAANESGVRNTIRIETPSTLRNRLLQVNVTQSWEEAEYSSTYGPQPYGLVRPVRVVPYREVRVDM